MLKINNRNTRTSCEIRSNDAIGDAIVNFKRAIAGWDMYLNWLTSYDSLNISPKYPYEIIFFTF